VADLPLYNRAGEKVGHALVDDGFQTKHRWHLHQGYPARTTRRRKGKLHHLGTFADKVAAAKVASDFRREHLSFSYEGEG